MSASTDRSGSDAAHGSMQARFLAVHFAHWLVDTEIALLRRTLSRFGILRAPATDEDGGVRAAGGTHPGSSMEGKRPVSSATMQFHDRRGLGVPLVVVAQRHRVHQVLGACDLARARGVSVGMTVSQAEGCVPMSGQIDRCETRASCGEHIHGEEQAVSAHAEAVLRGLRALRGEHDADGAVRGGAIDALSMACTLGGVRWGDRIVSCSDRMVAIEWHPLVSAKAIERLAFALQRWLPIVAVDGVDGVDGGDDRASPGDAHPLGSRTLVADFTGCSRLFRRRFKGERDLMQAIGDSFGRRGFRVDIATASTVGMALAAARFIDRRPARSISTRRDGGTMVPPESWRCTAIPHGSEREALSELPLAALRLESDAIEALHSVEVERVGQLMALGRAGVAARLSGDARARTASDPSRKGSGGGVRSTGSRAGAAGGPGRSHHVAGTGRWRGSDRGRTPSLFEMDIDTPMTSCDRDSIVHAAAGSSRTASRRSGVAGRTAMRALDALERLDRALGPSARTVRTGCVDWTVDGAWQGGGSMGAVLELEQMRVIRVQDPPRLQHAFDGICTRTEWLYTVCGGMLEQLLLWLRRNEVGLRSALWIFTHSDLPADASTDASVATIPMDKERSREDERGRDRESGCARGRPITMIPMRLTRPSTRGLHLWSMLRGRLERVPLDHGIESIECRIEHAPRLRARQRCLLAIGPAGPRSNPPYGAAQPAVLPGGAEEGARASGVVRMPDAWRGAPFGAGQAEWIDLVQSTLGVAALSRPVCEPQLGECAVHGPTGPPLRENPAIVLPVAERAYIEGGMHVDAIARAIANRTLWIRALHADHHPIQRVDALRESDDMPPGRSGRAESTSAPELHHPTSVVRVHRLRLHWTEGMDLPAVQARSPHADFPHAGFSQEGIAPAVSGPTGPCVSSPALMWRGCRWHLHAIDGWERVADHWWASERAPPASSSATSAVSQRHDGSGRVYARLQIGSGLWVRVRWPESLHSPAQHRLWPAFRSMDAWLNDAVEALSAGVEVEVCGIWA